jgi:hypothetical protein
VISKEILANAQHRVSVIDEDPFDLRACLEITETGIFPAVCDRRPSVILVENGSSAGGRTENC